MISLLNLVIIPPALCVICYMFGSILALKKEMTIGEKVILGFVGILALFQVVALPFMYYESSFTPLYGICIGFLIAVFIIYVVLVVRKKTKLNTKEEIVLLCTNKTKEKVLFWLFIFVLIALHVFSILYFQRVDPDDSYYLAQMNTVLDTNYLYNVEPSLGLSQFEANVTYKLVGHEVLVAVVAKLFHANIAFLCHMVLPLFIVPLHYAVVYQLAKKIKSKYKEIFVLLCVFVNLFASFSGASASAFLSYRPWQGKAIMVSIVFPLLLLEFWKIYEKKTVSHWNLFIMILLLWAGFCTTTVGLYLVPIAYFMYTTTFFLTYRDIKNSVKLCAPIFLCLPFVFVKFLTLMSQTGYFEESSDSSIRSITYASSLFSKYLRGEQGWTANYVVAIFFLIAILYIWRKGDKLEKMAFVYAPGVLFLTFANPFLFSLIARYVTGEVVYWRIFWIPQFRYIVVIAMLLYISEDIRRKFVSTLVMVLIITGTGDYVFKAPRYKERSNRYKISDRAVFVSDAIIEDHDEKNNYLLIPYPAAYEVRQYTGKVRLVWGRYASSAYNEADYTMLERMYDQLYEKKRWNAQVLEERMEYFHVNYIFLYKDSLKKNKIPDNLEKVFAKDDYVLYKVR